MVSRAGHIASFVTVLHLQGSHLVSALLGTSLEIVTLLYQINKVLFEAYIAKMSHNAKCVSRRWRGSRQLPRSPLPRGLGESGVARGLPGLGALLLRVRLLPDQVWHHHH